MLLYGECVGNGQPIWAKCQEMSAKSVRAFFHEPEHLLLSHQYETYSSEKQY